MCRAVLTYSRDWLLLCRGASGSGSVTHVNVLDGGLDVIYWGKSQTCVHVQDTALEKKNFLAFPEQNHILTISQEESVGVPKILAIILPHIGRTATEYPVFAERRMVCAVTHCFLHSRELTRLRRKLLV